MMGGLVMTGSSHVQPGQHRETALNVNDKTEHRYDGSLVMTMRGACHNDEGSLSQR